MEKLRIFYTIATCKSFTKAAEILGLTQPDVSLQIKSLEKEYCTKLFEKIGKEIFLTDSGKVLLVYAEKILSTMEEANLALKECNNPLRGRVNFGASMLVGTYILPSLLGNFKKAYPEISFSIKIRYAKDLITLLENNDIDFCVVGEGSKKQLGKTLFFTPLLKDELVFIMPPKHKLADKKIVSVSEVLKEKLILPEKYSATRNYIDSEFQKLGFTIEPYLEIGNIEVVKKIVEEDFGSGILSWISVRNEVKDKKLRAAKIEGLKLIRNVFLIKRQEKTFFPATTLFVDFLKENTKSVAKQLVFKE